MTRAALALLLSLAGCTETIRFEGDPIGELIAITVEPRDATLAITQLGSPPATLAYHAVGTFADGSTRDVSDTVTWAIDRDELGVVEPGGTFVASQTAAGYATVAARAGNLAGTAPLLVTVDATIVDATFPPPAAGLFDPARPVVVGDPTRAPALVYPAAGTVFPKIISSTLFQLDAGASNDAFELSFETPVLRLRVETGSDRWRADGDLQRLLANAAGIDPLRIRVHATSAASPSVFASAPVEVMFSTDLGDTPLYFWSSGARGVMRGAMHVPTATKQYPGTSTTCVGCHTVSRDGHTLAAAVDAGSGNPTQLEVADVTTMQPRIAASAARPTGWTALSPDGTRVVVAVNGALAEYDARTGQALGSVPLPANRYATHPDWSPDGTRLAVALTAQVPTSYDVRAASIAVLPYDNGTWGAPQIVVAGSAANNVYFPRWGPTGGVLAFVRATTGSQAAASAELMIVGATGGTPRSLVLANRRVGNADVVDVANTMPAWAPPFGPRVFLAFASARPYGKIVSGRSQIWITSLDLTNTSDPSTPAFWVPCQDVTVANNTPVWSGEIITQ